MFFSLFFMQIAMWIIFRQDLSEFDAKKGVKGRQRGWLDRKKVSSKEREVGKGEMAFRILFPSLDIRWNERRKKRCRGRVERRRWDCVSRRGQSFFHEMENCNCNLSRFCAFAGKRRLSAFAGCQDSFAVFCWSTTSLPFPPSPQLIKTETQLDTFYVLNSSGWWSIGPHRLTDEHREAYLYWWHSSDDFFSFHSITPLVPNPFPQNVIKFFSGFCVYLRKLLLKPTDPTSLWRHGRWGDKLDLRESDDCKLISLPSWTSRRHSATSKDWRLRPIRFAVASAWLRFFSPPLCAVRLLPFVPRNKSAPDAHLQVN